MLRARQETRNSKTKNNSLKWVLVIYTWTVLNAALSTAMSSRYIIHFWDFFFLDQEFKTSAPFFFLSISHMHQCEFWNMQNQLCCEKFKVKGVNKKQNNTKNRFPPQFIMTSCNPLLFISSFSRWCGLLLKHEMHLKLQKHSGSQTLTSQRFYFPKHKSNWTKLFLNSWQVLKNLVMIVD